MSRLDALLGALPRWTLVAGKGGVGKTTCATALAARAAVRGDETLLLSTDPARSLGAALGSDVEATPSLVAGRDRLFAMQLDAPHEREIFLARWRDVLRVILDRGTYLEAGDIAGIVDDALPGADEAMAVIALLDLERSARWDRIIVDTAPTGHTLRLLALPDTFRALVALLDTMQDKHRFMVRALTRRWRADAADAFLIDMRERVDALRATLTDPKRTAVVLVTRPDPMVVAETVRYADALKRLSMRVAAVVINAIPGDPSPGVLAAAADLEGVAPGAIRIDVPMVPDAPNGLGEIEALFAGAAAPPAKRPTDRQVRSPSSSSYVIAAALRPLTIVAGKGGVGKTTVACATAVAVARPEAPLLIVSSDP
ncbi:MAG: ArsA family ATPase, partial [Gemmatimonadota bacterium]|nr:ArsA family ATPase [Gemmatimonadota bacterium]